MQQQKEVLQPLHSPALRRLWGTQNILVLAVGQGFLDHDPGKVIIHGSRILTAGGQDEAAVLLVVVDLLAAGCAQLVFRTDRGIDAFEL